MKSRQRHRQQPAGAGLTKTPPLPNSDLGADVLRWLERILPRGAVALVVSKGDPSLVRTRHFQAWHFPRNEEGDYAGFHPGCSTSALAHLEALRADGAGYLVFPPTAFWWLSHYTAFARRLQSHYRRLSTDADPCLVYALNGGAVETPRSAESELCELIAEFRLRFARDPHLLDWASGLSLADVFPDLPVLSHPATGSALPYRSDSLDIVVTGPAQPAATREARRLARFAVLESKNGRSEPEIQRLRTQDGRRLLSVSLIIPCYNQAGLTAACLRSLFETLPAAVRLEVLVVDDGSTDETPKLLEAWQAREPRLRVVHQPGNLGFGAACNRAAREARGALLVFANNDVLFLPGWLEPLLQVMQSHPLVGAVGGKLILPDGRLQEAGGVIFGDGSAMNFGRGEAELHKADINFLREVDYCSAALLATRKTLFNRLGGFDHRYGRAYYEDVDYCFRLRESGYRVLYQPAAAVVHREGGTAGKNLKQGVKRAQVDNQQRFIERWQHQLRHQPVRPMRAESVARLTLALRIPQSLKPQTRPPLQRALVCAAFPPEPDRDGGSQRLWQLISILQNEGWTVTFFASEQLRDPRYVLALQQRGVAVFSASSIAFKNLLAAGRYHVAFLVSWPVAEACLPVLRRYSTKTRIIVDSVDLHFLRHARQAFTDPASRPSPVQLNATFGTQLTRELNVYAAADTVLAISNREAHLLQDLIPRPGLVQVLPDFEESEPSPTALTERRGILLAGSFRHSPNVDALKFLCHDILPRVNTRLRAKHPLLIVGDPADADLASLTAPLPHVQLVGWVPDLRPYVEHARLTVVPLRYGAGTKRKLLQSLFMGTPAVSTTVGAEGLGIRHGRHLLVADTPEGFAQAIERLLTHDRLWRSIARNGQAFAQAAHSKLSSRRQLRRILRVIMGHQPNKLPGSVTGFAETSSRLDLQQYHDLQDRIRTHLHSILPVDSRVLVVSRGDDALVRLDGVNASHFPQTENGVYAGYHPADSQAAILHLEALCTQGAQYLVFPQTSLWWLDHYEGFAKHLDQCHTRVFAHGDCVVFQLGKPAQRQKATRPANAATKASGTANSRIKAVNHTYDVICLPIIEWGFRWQRPQQLMARFAAAGHRVFYVSHTGHQTASRIRLNRVMKNVFEVSLRGPRLDVYGDVLSPKTTALLLASFKALQSRKSIRQALLTVQLPFWWPLAQQARRTFAWPVLYDCMDHHAGFTTNQPRMLAHEPQLLAQADLVVVSSLPLETKALQHNPNVLLLRNGCDYHHFAKVPSRRPKRRTVIGYYGAIAHWFDADLVAELAERRPDWQFILVGSTHTADLGRLEQLPNVTLPGEQPYETLPRWLARFDVLIIPFKRSPLTESTNPVKAYEILAAGKPLVTVPLPEMHSFGTLIQTASTPEEFERAIEQGLRSQSPADVAERRRFAQQHTWQSRFETLAHKIQEIGFSSPPPVPQPRRRASSNHPPTHRPQRTKRPSPSLKPSSSGVAHERRSH